MAQLVVRRVDEDVKKRLKRRAERHGRSLEEEVRHILRDAVKTEKQPPAKLGSRIAALFKETGLTLEIPELRGQAPRIPDFTK
jgi:plasmid stability protein